MPSCGARRTAAQSRKQNTPRSKTAPVRTAPCGSSSYGSQGIPPESYRCPPPCSAPSAQGRSACPSRQDSSHTNCSPACKAKRHTAIKSPQCRKAQRAQFRIRLQRFDRMKRKFTHRCSPLRKISSAPNTRALSIINENRAKTSLTRNFHRFIFCKRICRPNTSPRLQYGAACWRPP